MTDAEIVYEGYTAAGLAESLNPEVTIDDLPAYQQENGALSAAARERLPGTCNIAYGAEEAQKLDIFAPAGSGNPVLIDIHGGGWRGGSKDGRSLVAEAITGAGALWVPIDYGLAPAYRMDQIVDHVRSALTWVYNNIAEHGGDPDRIYVSGNSAGGHLTGATLMPGWHGDYGVPENVIKGACAMSGIFDLRALYHAEGGYKVELGLDLPTAETFSPLLHLPENGCPLIIGYGAPELDEFRRQSHVYYEAWKNAGFDATEVIVDGAHHFAMSRELANTVGALHKAVVEMINN